MTIGSSAGQARLMAAPQARNEMGWLLAAAAAFLIVHIVALTIWGRASASETASSQPETISLLCD